MNFSEPTIRLNKIMSRNASVGIFRLWRRCPHLPLTSKLDTAAWGMRSGFVKPVSRATSQVVLRIYDALTCIIYTQEYRRGHNEAVLKTVCPKGTGVRIPLPAPNKKQQIDTIVSTYCFLFIVKNQQKVLVNQGLFCFCGAFRYMRCLYVVPRKPQNAEKHYSPSRCSAFLSLKDRYSLNY